MTEKKNKKKRFNRFRKPPKSHEYCVQKKKNITFFKKKFIPKKKFDPKKKKKIGTIGTIFSQKKP